MIDPLGLIGAQNIQNPNSAQAKKAGDASSAGPAFKDVLMDNLAQVNKLQQDATRAVEDLHTQKRDDLETVLSATVKADTAFRMLLAVRNKVMEAYKEIQQIRV